MMEAGQCQFLSSDARRTRVDIAEPPRGFSGRYRAPVLNYHHFCSLSLKNHHFLSDIMEPD